MRPPFVIILETFGHKQTGADVSPDGWMRDVAIVKKCALKSLLHAACLGSDSSELLKECHGGATVFSVALPFHICIISQQEFGPVQRAGWYPGRLLGECPLRFHKLGRR